MFDKSQIMKDAWAHFREIHATYADWQFERGIHDGSFSNALKVAWRQAKARAAEIARKLKEMANPQVVALRQSIEALTYKGFAHNIKRERAVLEGRINAIMAGA